MRGFTWCIFSSSLRRWRDVISRILHSACCPLDALSTFLGLHELLLDPVSTGICVTGSSSCTLGEHPASWASWSRTPTSKVFGVYLPIANFSYPAEPGLRYGARIGRRSDCVPSGVCWSSSTGLSWNWLLRRSCYSPQHFHGPSFSFRLSHHR